MSYLIRLIGANIYVYFHPKSRLFSIVIIFMKRWRRVISPLKMFKTLHFKSFMAPRHLTTFFPMNHPSPTSPLQHPSSIIFIKRLFQLLLKSISINLQFAPFKRKNQSMKRALLGFYKEQRHFISCFLFIRRCRTLVWCTSTAWYLLILPASLY